MYIYIYIYIYVYILSLSRHPEGSAKAEGEFVTQKRLRVFMNFSDPQKFRPYPRLLFLLF